MTMTLLWRTPFFLLTLIIPLKSENSNNYQREKEKIIEQELSNSLGGNLELCDDEDKANDIIMGYKETEWNQSYNFPKNFKFSKNYILYKDLIQASVLYHIIKKMPKGAALHVHNSFVLNTDYLMEITYEDNLYACVKNDVIKFRFAECTPELPCATEWKLMSELRESAGDVDSFDAELREQVSLVTVNDEMLNADSKTIWEKFDKIYSVISPLVNYRPVREKYLLESLKSFYEDKVMYIEMRGSAAGIYELNGTEWASGDTIKLYCDITQQFMEEHPDFVGVKWILTKHRTLPVRELKKSLNLYKQIKAKYPGIMAGFDLVGEEESRSLEDVAPALLEFKSSADYYLHAGETIWYGSSADENLLDAILLGAKRIGHGFALSKHPLLMDMIKEKDIAVEVCVVSNMVLGLVKDVRHHPLVHLLAANVPVVLSSDDPGLWDGMPASHDFYLTFIAIANRRADLRLLKQLALNSIKYSALDTKRKKKLSKIFNKQWNSFISEVISTYDNDARRQDKTANQAVVENSTVVSEIQYSELSSQYPLDVTSTVLLEAANRSSYQSIRKQSHSEEKPSEKNTTEKI